MKLYNTLTRRVEEIVPIHHGKVGMYICGPTVYDYAHIGHGRTYVNSDVLVRALRWSGYDVNVVMNITDVGHLTSDQDTGEDKVEKKAREEKKDVWEITEHFTADFWQMGKLLNIGRPNVVSKATDHIQEMIDLVKRLEQRGFTYKTTDGVYFDTSKLADYGKLARLEPTKLKEGARVEKNPEKKNPTDFALWKFAKKGEKRQMEWESPWGNKSFPGWHIECSAMSMKYLGESFDIHTGGTDHIPVHHTNEIAQSEAATEKRFVKYWFHSGFLMVEGEKMSKSLGNFIRVVDVVKKGYDALALRYLFLTGHYRTTMNFTWKAMDAAQKGYQKLVEAAAEFREDRSRTVLSREKLKGVDRLRKKFTDAVNNDLGIPETLAVMWELVKSNVPGRDKYELMEEFDKVLGLGLAEARQVQRGPTVPEEVQELIDKRQQLRGEKKFKESDKVRREIEKKGFVLEDSPGGAVVRRKLT